MRPVILDSGAVTTLARENSQTASDNWISQAGRLWSIFVPSLVLVECLAGQQRTDAVVNLFLKKCEVLDGPHQRLARRASAIRAKAGRGSAVDAVVVAMAEPGGAVLTHDINDLTALAAHAQGVRVFSMN